MPSATKVKTDSCTQVSINTNKSSDFDTHKQILTIFPHKFKTIPFFKHFLKMIFTGVKLTS